MVLREAGVPHSLIADNARVFLLRAAKSTL